MSTFANSEDPDEMQHFIRVYTVCKGKNDLQTKKYNSFQNYYPTSLDMYKGLSQETVEILYQNKRNNPLVYKWLINDQGRLSKN